MDPASVRNRGVWTHAGKVAGHRSPQAADPASARDGEARGRRSDVDIGRGHAGVVKSVEAVRGSEIGRGHARAAKPAPTPVEACVHTGKADDRRSLSSD
ncbi:hypothetical protein COCNU_02G019260 [Cocos nucifera]|uniref:Uncharacterized protein n=1 Tax=Cocos nucifera TaxID=13894 RepID=A0A8K0I0Y6_COCNU|nr:hypothetical protein COCNU_02G019260 [Cocos nucifera]